MSNFVLRTAALVLGVAAVRVFAAGEPVAFNIDGTLPGRALPNTQQMLCVWSLPRTAFRSAKRNLEHDVLEFAEYVEVMGATGGSRDRDCFKNPDDRGVLDDYDFSRLVEGCRNVVKLGLKPYLKLGNVPLKLSADMSAGDFHTNVRPPEDYAAYGRYMAACADALIAAFGRDVLCRWRFAVLTEFENGGWFKDASGDAEKTFIAYCRLYETTIECFVNRISPNLTIGVHAMAVTEGLWDERRFIRYAAERKLPLKFVTASFYDRQPGLPTTGMSLPKTIAHLREAAETSGLTNLVYGVDEGRILWGKTRKKENDNLFLRIVGDTYQAAYDARIVKQLFDSGADWFASWGYLSGPDVFFDGLPSVSFYVAQNAAQFVGMRRLPVSCAEMDGSVHGATEIDVVAAASEDRQRILVMAYAFRDELFAQGTTRLRISLRLPRNWAYRKVVVESRTIDDNVNWFDEWREERKRRGIGEDRFGWSPDCPAPMAGVGLKSAADRKVFKEELEPLFRECARLKPSVERVLSADGKVSLDRVLSVNSVVFLDVQAR